MTLIVTDRQLEDFFEHVPPKKGPIVDEIHTVNGKVIHTRSDLWNPYEYGEYLVHGPLKVRRWMGTLTPGPDPTPPKVDSLLLESGMEWFTYVTHDECRHSTMEQILFVYWYLANAGDRVCIYNQYCLEAFGPETPVARVDVSDKPLSDTILRGIDNDILYLFFDTKGSSVAHDTHILERMGKDPD